MRISDWSSDVCSSDLFAEDLEVDAVIVAPAPRSCVGDVFQIDGVVIGDPKAAAHDRPVLGELQRETPDLEPRKGGAVLLIGFDRLHAIDPALRYEEGADRQEGDHAQRQQQALARFPDQECGYRAATEEGPARLASDDRSEEHTT